MDHQHEKKSLQQALKDAGIKTTQQRLRVLDVLEHTQTPRSVPELMQDLPEDTLSTLYRTLDLFVQKGLALRSMPTGGTMACYERNRHQHKHYAVCLGCRKMINIKHCPIADAVPELGEAGFTIMGHELEIVGYCQSCTHAGGITAAPHTHG